MKDFTGDEKFIEEQMKMMEEINRVNSAKANPGYSNGSTLVNTEV